MRGSSLALSGPLRLSTLTELRFDTCYIPRESFDLIRPGSWPCLHFLCFDTKHKEQVPINVMKALFQLIEIEDLYFGGEGFAGPTFAQIKPGDWPHLQRLDMNEFGGEEFFNDFSDNPMGAIKGILYLTALRDLNVSGANLKGMSISQINPGDWPHLQRLDLRVAGIFVLLIQVTTMWEPWKDYCG